MVFYTIIYLGTNVMDTVSYGVFDMALPYWYIECITLLNYMLKRYYCEFIKYGINPDKKV